MKIAETKMLIASVLVFMTTSAQALQPEVLYGFQLGPTDPSGLIQGSDGDFYGTTYSGGANNLGTVFKVTTNGVLTLLASFNGTNGANPIGGLVLGSDGNLYGTTTYGGNSERYGPGTVFRVTTNGVLTSLVSFSGTNGAYPHAGLVLGSDDSFYGTTRDGGSSGYGAVFKVTTNGVLTTLVSFNADNGFSPQAELVLGRDGSFYGTTYSTVFQVTTNGVLTTLAWFNGANGAAPNELAAGSDGNLYGTTANGGPGGGGTIFRLVISPKFTNLARQPGGSLLLTGTGPFNGSYRLWASPDLSLPVAAWTLLTSNSFDSNGTFSYTDAGAATNPSRFYQLSVP